MKNLFLKKIGVPATIGWLLIGIHYLLFSSFFPNAQGKIGHDYSYDFPMLLDGYSWFLENGLFSVPWFTPSFCGGMPLFPSPATFYFSIIQFTSFFFDPMSAMKIALLVFGAIGFWGFYFLLRRIFLTESWPALLGGALFLFNGFFVCRLIVGHIEFHGFMLVPLVSLLLVRDEKISGGFKAWLYPVGSCVACGAMFAYMLYAGMAQMMLPTILVIIAIAIIKGMIDWDFPICRFFQKFFWSGLLGLGLAAAKLSSAFTFLANVPQHSYLLPGVDNISTLLLLILRVLALGGADVNSQDILANFQWLLNRHEFEFGVSLVPFLILLAGLSTSIKAVPKLQNLWRPRVYACLSLLLIILALPIVLNLYEPAWNAWLRATPYLKNISNFFRWFTIYIPLVILLACLCLDRMHLFKAWKPIAALTGLGLLLLQTLAVDMSFYHEQNYDPSPVMNAFANLRQQGSPTKITDIGATFDQFGQPLLLSDRNNALIQGQSQLFCYEPMFGYRLESYPWKTIHPGSALSKADGVLNLKNPACFLFPQDNNCTIGDHFRSDQLLDAERFLSFKPFSYQAPLYQRIANIISLVLLVAVFCFGLGLTAAFASRAFRR